VRMHAGSACPSSDSGVAVHACSAAWTSLAGFFLFAQRQRCLGGMVPVGGDAAAPPSRPNLNPPPPGRSLLGPLEGLWTVCLRKVWQACAQQPGRMGQDCAGAPCVQPLLPQCSAAAAGEPVWPLTAKYGLKCSPLGSWFKDDGCLLLILPAPLWIGPGTVIRV